MALTKNSRVAAARAKAAELARSAQSREAELLRLAGEYFIEQGEVEAVQDDAKAKGQELIRAAQKKADELEVDAVRASAVHEGNARTVVVQMLATGASIEDVAARVELSVGAVRKIKKASTPLETERLSAVVEPSEAGSAGQGESVELDQEQRVA